MLSYKHGFHAGNHADVFKHIVLIYLYNITKNHSKSISYIDTHSGNSLYKYISKYMDKNKEYKYGIKKIEKYDGNNKLIINYLKKLKIISKNNNFYPGSPYLISNISSRLDKLYFCELHNNEFESLKINLNKFTNVKIIKTDGFSYIERVLNNNKSFFVLIDPSYELKDDFDKVLNILDNIENKYEKCKIIIWYPILNYFENDIFIENIRKKAISNLLNLELPITTNNEDKGLKGSGLLILNFKEKKIFKDFKILLKDLSFNLKQDDDVYSPKIRYL
ncbi:MAG: hypothetical protein CBD97_02875 [Pelagibacteraceae bacterium TMED237]|nr:MAG: hypothetical protein CBD97_02875 [Pelagibacteraceae bacterium TMED237]